jgi:ATP-dependent Clp protease ATP-binding subunit ClpB
VFHALDQVQLRSIAALQIERLRKRLAERDIDIRLDEQALDLIASVGFDPVYGARPLKRAVQTELENPLSEKILGGEVLPGALVLVSSVDGKLTFTMQRDQ